MEQVRINLNGTFIPVTEDDYIITEGSGKYWWRIGYPIGNFGVSVIIQADTFMDALDDIGEIVNDSDIEQKLPRIILVHPKDIDEDNEEEYYAVNGGEFYTIYPSVAWRLQANGEWGNV